MTFANFSGGRDSSAMVIKWLESGNPLDYILFCDTGFEFPQMYEYIENFDAYLKRNFGMEISKIDARDKIEKWAFEIPISRGERVGMKRGLPPTLGSPFCTREAKVNPSKNFILDKSPNKFRNKVLIGYTYDEVERGRTTNLDYAVAVYPLHEYKMNEPEVDAFLKERKIINPLYNHFKRTGCFFCPKQNMSSLYALWKHYPEQWEVMKEWEARAKQMECINQQWTIKWSMQELEKRFSGVLDLSFNDEFSQDDMCFCGR